VRPLARPNPTLRLRRFRAEVNGSSVFARPASHGTIRGVFGLGKTIIAPASDRNRSAAVRFLLSGARRDSLAREYGHSFEQMLAARRVRPDIWCARKGAAVRAAAMVLPNPGRTGFLFYSPLQSPGVRAAAAAPVVRAACKQGLENGLCFVQALLGEEGGPDAHVLTEAGLRRLAELIYMRLETRKRRPPSSSGSLAFVTAEEFREEQLRRVIAATYEGSRDCPLLCGLRPPEDVIAGHRGAGVYRPGWWWIALRDGQPAGCLLLNESADHTEAEVVYTGVIPAHRGKGVCAAMLRRAALAAAEKGLAHVTLAVDSANEPARRVYDAEGFVATDRRTAYVAMPAERGAAGSEV